LGIMDIKLVLFWFGLLLCVTDTFESQFKCGIVQKVWDDGYEISGGYETDINEYPWMISLKYHSHHMCGGSLISNRWIISAAHCFHKIRKQIYRNNPNDWIAVLGDHNRAISNEANHLDMKISCIVIHPKRNHKTKSYDVALLRMKKKLDLSYYPHIRPICLPQNDKEDYVGKNVITTGWGRRQPDGHSTKILREVDLHVISNDACQENYHSQITDQMICAIGESGTQKDACKGDSGGPLIAKKKGKNSYELIGITSFGKDCGNGDSEVFTRVSKQIRWIKSVISRRTFCPTLAQP